MLTTRKSSIAGNGVFTDADIRAGQKIGLMLDWFSKGIAPANPDNDVRRTALGEMVNHSDNPNCAAKLIQKGEWLGYLLVSGRDIKAGEELTVDYAKFCFDGKRDFAKETRDEREFSDRQSL